MSIVAADVEGTLTTGETWRGVGRYLSEHGRGLAYRVFFLTHMPALVLAVARVLPRQSFRDRWMIDLARFFRGATEPELHAMAEWVVERELWPLRRAPLIAELEEHARRGADLVLSSATYQPILEVFARRLGARAVGTPFEVVDGRATGRLEGPVNSGHAKAERLAAATAARPIAVAYGDTAADVPMLERSLEAIAVHPDARLRAFAEQRGWRIWE